MDARFRKEAITADEQAALSGKKKELRIENEHYLRDHPEVKQIADYFLRQVLVTRPANIQEYACALLSDPSLRQKVDAHAKQAQAFSKAHP